MGMTYIYNQGFWAGLGLPDKRGNNSKYRSKISEYIYWICYRFHSQEIQKMTYGTHEITSCPEIWR